LIESFCTEIQNLFQGIKERLERTWDDQKLSPCVTWVIREMR
jgi:hypothetical protein